jgi:hypothetical protein
MAHRLEARVRKIETALQGPAQMRIIAWHTEDERKSKIQHMIASGLARDDDFFVCVRRFADEAT